MVARATGEGKPPAIGATDPQVTIVIFTDARCPVCRATEAAIAARMRRDPTIRLVIRDWPILTPGSLRAARAAIAADGLPAYAALHHALIREPGALNRRTIGAAAAAAGIDPALLARRETADAVRIDALLASTARLAGLLGLPGTPGLLVGDRLVRGGVDGLALDRLIAQARRS